jgi:hypothetical protein
MKRALENDYVGYKCPPAKYQWKKGQSGNPRPSRKNNPRKISQIVEDALAREIDIVENGIMRRCSVFEAILLQLLKHVMAGNSRALRVWYKYEAFAKRRPDFIVVTDEDRKKAAEAYGRILEEP